MNDKIEKSGDGKNMEYIFCMLFVMLSRNYVAMETTIFKKTITF